MTATPGDNHWNELEELFHAALALAPTDRTAFLDRACSDNYALRSEVQMLLDSSEKSWGFFQNVWQTAAQNVAGISDPIGQHIGNYTIVGLLGMGGMGEVYLAERADDLYQQRVAIKLVRTGIGRTSELLLRFSGERQILANLAHPNIARLLDAGITPEGSPYLVMEHIEGIPIDQYVASRRLSLMDRLKLFRQVCAAVEYAHRNLVVHRDIKPANILVTKDGTPKLLDFGIAKLLQSEGASPPALTRATERLMTPEYASPEQARGQTITTATDVYALGALLYALLAGRPPFRIESKDPLEVAKIICEQPPTRPSASVQAESTLPAGDTRKLKGDLDNIVLKTLRKEPEKRYTTVAELSEDVRRYLEGYPLQGGSNAWNYRATKFIQRHMIGVVAATLMMSAIVVFSIAMGVLAQQATRERNKARQEQLKSEQETKFLSGLFNAATPDAERGKTISARDILDLSAKRIDRELTTEPEVRAAMLNSIGASYLALGLYSQAQPLLEEAYSLRRLQPGTQSLDFAESASNLAMAQRGLGKYPKEEGLLREALEVREKLAPDNAALLGDTLSNLGECLYLQSHFQDAESVLRRAIAVSPENTPIMAGAKNYLALVLEREGGYEEAVGLLRSSVEMTARNEGTDSPDYLVAMHNLAAAQSTLGNLLEAEATERKVLEIRQRVSGKEHPDTTYSLNNLGWILLEQGDAADAEPYLKEGLEINRKQLGDKHPRVATSLTNWARILQAKGDYSGADKAYREALAILEENKALQSWQASRIETNLGTLELDRGDYASAERHFRQALELRRNLGGTTNPDFASSLIDVAVARAFQVDPGGAETLLRQALEIRKTLFASVGQLRIVAVQVRLGEALTDEGKLDEAEIILRQATQLAHTSPVPLAPWQVAEADSALGVCLERRGQMGEARKLLQNSNAVLKTYPDAALRKRALQRASASLKDTYVPH